MIKGPLQKTISAILFSIAIASGAWMYTKNLQYMWYWVFGLFFGVVLQHFRVCFVSAATEPLITGSTEQIRAILIGILLSSLGITTIKYLSNGMLDMLGVSAISIPLMLGAFIFGIGMVISGCCSAGAFIRIGEGYVIHLFTLAGIIGGYLFANSHYQSLWATYIVNAPAIFLPTEVGWLSGVGMHLIIIVLLYLVALKQEQGTSSSNSTALLKGAVLIGVFVVLHYLVMKSSWSVTGAFFWIGEWFKSLSGNSAILSSPSEEVLLIAIGPNLRNLGLFSGALISTFACGRFKIKKIRSVKQVIVSILGGILMGYGACLAGGCNISAFFTAAASLSLSAWAFAIFLFIGAFVGTKILYKLL